MDESTVYDENWEEVEAFWTRHGKPFEGLATALHKAAERVVQQDWDWNDLHAIADALDSGDLRIVSAARLAALGRAVEVLREVRDHTDAKKNPNFTVRDVLAIRYTCDKALAELDAIEGGDAK